MDNQVPGKDWRKDQVDTKKEVLEWWSSNPKSPIENIIREAKIKNPELSENITGALSNLMKADKFLQDSLSILNNMSLSDKEDDVRSVDYLIKFYDKYYKNFEAMWKELYKITKF